MTSDTAPQGTLADGENGSSPTVAVVIPCRNEVDFIAQCLDSIVQGDYPADRLEILVVDGMSDDGTRETILGFQERFPSIRIIDNPDRTTARALNRALAATASDVIIRVDAHARIQSDYISRCVATLLESGAENVGGIMRTVPRGKGFIGQLIVATLSHPFGVGNSYFRIHTADPRYVDTVFGGCYPRRVFDRVGLFNDRLDRGQDMEFNLRLKKAGGRTLLVPDIVSDYYARSDLVSFVRHNFVNGRWAVIPFLRSRFVPVTLKHLVPLLFVLAVLGGAVNGVFGGPLAWWPFIAIVLSYGAAALVAAGSIARGKRHLGYVIGLPPTFGLLHVCYGTGSLVGLIEVAWHLARGQRRPRAHDDQQI